MREAEAPPQVFRAEKRANCVKTLSFTGLALGLPDGSG